MTTLVKFIIAFSLSITGDSTTTYESIEAGALRPYTYATVLTVSDAPKEKALQILKNKCNVCHSKRNRRRVFTLAKMDRWANDVYLQVFLKKRMPKGKKIKLTQQEYQDLLTWITNTQNR